MLSVRQKMFVARMLNLILRPLRRLAGRGMRTRCARKGIEWELDLDEGIDLCIYLLGAYEPRTLRAFSPYVKPGAVVLDIGANIGAHTLHFARLVGPAGRVYAFEPSDYGCAKMRANLALNPGLAARVSVQQRFLVADGAEPMPATVYCRWPVANEHHDLNADHLGKPEPLAGATAVTADGFCEGLPLERLDFVKLDVDGHELQVLEGFRRSLARFRPAILVELAPYVYKGTRTAEFDEFVNLIADLGYDFTEARSGELVSRDPAQLRRQITPGGSMNCLLFHRGGRGTSGG
jgi:FkbM family methyltransferase